MPKRPVERSLTLSGAAEASGASRVTLRRRLDAGAFPNAYQAAVEGIGRRDTWRIPVGDLLAAGFVLYPDGRAPARAPARRIAALEARVAELEREVGTWKAKAADWENGAKDTRVALDLLPREGT